MPAPVDDVASLSISGCTFMGLTAAGSCCCSLGDAARTARAGDDGPGACVDSGVKPANILAKLTGKIPGSYVSSEQWNHLSSLELADPAFNIPGPIDILLGANIYGHLLTGELLSSGPSSPVAQRTVLGWVVSGPTSEQSDQPMPASRVFSCTADNALHESVKQFWAQEVVDSPREGGMSAEDRRCEDHFRDTHTRDSTGRYIVRLPFCAVPAGAGESRAAAEGMLKRMHRRFDRDPTFKELYTTFMDEYLQLGHMERVETPEDNSYFLPHHGVLRESSLSTKLRVVFNGSQKSSSGDSLNDALHAGPKLQQDLIDVLMRWRLARVVFSSDVEKMYRQIVVHQDDRKYQCVLWSNSEDSAPATFRLSTVTYGLKSAPYLALRVVHQLADDEGDNFPMAASVLRNNMYVDDVLGGGDTVEETQEKVSQVDRLLMAGGFILKKWVANEKTVLSSNGEDRRLPSDKTFEDNEVLRALGLKWSPSSDSFLFTFNEEAVSTEPATKRSVLSLISRLFDPLGWLAPVVVQTKIFLQTLWTTKLQWDDPLPPTLAEEWKTIVIELNQATSFSIPRWLGTRQDSTVELLGFSDASRSALGAVVYVRVLEGDFYRTTLLIAKTRVAPLKPVTIARLELSAAVLLAQLLSRARTALKLTEAPIHLWTDSSVALTWIRGTPSQWKEYVSNRVALIQELIPDGTWRHVAGADNPADAASRGLFPRQLCVHPTWWSGPDWLRFPATSWPNSLPSIADGTNLEEKPVVVMTVTPAPEIWSIVQSYSRIERLLRITAIVMAAARLFKNFRRRGEEESVIAPTGRVVLDPVHLDRALRFWVGVTQEAYFLSDIRQLQSNKPLPKSSPLLRLMPFLDDEGLVRVGGRLQKASLDQDCRHPLILPRSSKLSERLIEEAHRKLLHGGVQLTLATLRQRFWIIGGRVPVQKFIRNCVPCVRQRGQTLQQQMGQLPTLRTQPARPFANSGVDYAGPFSVKTWKGRNAKCLKCYIVVFVCFCSSAVHLELVSDYTAEGFLAAFRRFTSRRGPCARLTSDCGTNFIGASAELRKLFSSASEEFARIRSALADDRTEWRFNPPSAPHFGGKWEAAVKSVKYHLRRVVGDHLLTFEEFNTLLIQIEGVLNSRPICPLSDPSDFSALTPGHFLTGGPISAVPEPSLSHLPTSRLSQWQKTKFMLEHFWSRWSREYLTSFQTVPKWHRPDHQLKIGALVLVSDERYPPSKWPLARVLDLHPGDDGLVRVATVKTAYSAPFKRPLVKLCLLPVSE